MSAKKIKNLLLFSVIAPLILFSGCKSIEPVSYGGKRIIHADVVALDHDIQFNRFGSHDPYGMIYALKRDVEGKGNNQVLQPGNVRLRSGKRARPLALRVHAGDILEVTFTNLLNPRRPSLHKDEEPEGNEGAEPPPRENPLEAAVHVPGSDAEGIDACKPAEDGQKHGDAPATRCVSIALSGMPLADGVDANNPLNTGLRGVAPGEEITYRWQIPDKADTTYLFSSLSAPAGGEGDGGSLVHGLFGTLSIEPEDSDWYRSAVTEDELKMAVAQAKTPNPDCHQPVLSNLSAYINYQAVDSRCDPVLSLLKQDKNRPNRYELIHSPLDAIIVDKGKSYREFTVTFHDELKTVYAEPFKELGMKEFEDQLAGVGDGFAINYGASGMGTILIANRKGIGPAKHCVDCLYEEFFLQSWANGDPALLMQYRDDPSNVHHSYLGDEVKFRNSHAGPKETHVFHLHAHQWESSQSGYSNYLDSQTIAPQQSFAYAIAHNGSGNRNLTPGDSIFHCHLYPHFAQGMWALWRVHDVFENGSRRLPDGDPAGRLDGSDYDPELLSGTDPETGITSGGTPIPAIVPMPGKAMPPNPSYPADFKPGSTVRDSKTGEVIAKPFPGYPFYIPGKAGHRVPQPPLDIVENGGLGRHLVDDGDVEKDRVFNGGAGIAEQLANADMTAHIKKVNLSLLDEEGTRAERAAMAFHEKQGYPSKTPEGKPMTFRVNGHKRQHGAPFADPCGEDPDAPIRRYRASAIDLDILTNEHGWHDPQARINILDKTLAQRPERFGKKKMTKDVEPFFFRVESGECVEFLHTNRSGKDIRRDDFQVATPTDIIGQHIHLVKFDVTASDGSANGFNYQDGTFSYEAIKELAEASRKGKVIHFRESGEKEKVAPRPAPKTDNKGNPVFQATIQRWWADGHPHKDGSDGTLGTVFTHDHFAPSSIQQHGFYNAMLVEPKGSIWQTPDGTDMKTGMRAQANGKPAPVANASKDISCKAIFNDRDLAKDTGNDNAKRDCVESFAVGSRGMVITSTSGTASATDKDKHKDAREFALAIADFALLYDKGQQTGLPMPKGMMEGNKPVSRELTGFYAKIRQDQGYPVDPPEMPEAISTHHHNPYLVNYKHEPIPLRIGKRDRHGGLSTDFSSLLPARSDCTNNIHVLEQDHLATQLCSPADMAYVFSSHAPHGDPFLKPFRAYEGDRVNIRMVQGAQEVQHSFTMHGLSWKRESHNPHAPPVNAQEIGISEHFEIGITNLGNIGEGLKTSDYLFNFGTQDDLWNGSWGLLRAFANPEAYDPVRCEDERTGVLKVSQLDLMDKAPSALKKAGCPLEPVSVQPEKPCVDGGRMDDSCALAVLPDNKDGRIFGKTGDGRERLNEFVRECPEKDSEGKAISRVVFNVEAWQVKDLLNDRNGVYYDKGNRITDPDALVYIQAGDKPAVQNGAKVLEPLVLRAPADSCVELHLTNHLLAKDKEPSDGKGDALMPGITSLNVDAADSKHEVKPSRFVSIHPQLVAYNPTYGDGAVVGLNDFSNSMALPNDNNGVTYHWYTGKADLVSLPGNKEEVVVKRPFGRATVAGLFSAGDVIGHGSHGLIGALVIEPKGSQVYFPYNPDDSDDARGELWPYPVGKAAMAISPGLSAVVFDGKTKEWVREFVVFYQDGINLQTPSGPAPDCRICDDSYDLGEKAVNYHSAAFGPRLGRMPVTDGEGRDTVNLNDTVFPVNFFDPDYRPLPFADFQAKAGEKLRFHVLQPSGRGRQRIFQLYGHQFEDDIPRYGSPWNRLIAPGITHTAEVKAAKPGVWLYRDGPAHIFAAGSWGRLVVDN